MRPLVNEQVRALAEAPVTLAQSLRFLVRECWCGSRFELSTKLLLQLSLVHLFFACVRALCLRSLELWEKVLSHSGQAWSRSPTWTCWCLVNWVRFLKAIATLRTLEGSLSTVGELVL